VQQIKQHAQNCAERSDDNMEMFIFYPSPRNTKLVCVELQRQDNRDWLLVYFSYDTAVAFYSCKREIIVSQNVWSKTTGRHLNEIDGGAKEKRVPYNEFKKLLAKALQAFVTKQSKGENK